MSMTDDEKLYTLFEAKLEIRRQNCAAHGHQPSGTAFTTHGAPMPLKVLCECQGVEWTPAPVRGGTFARDGVYSTRKENDRE